MGDRGVVEKSNFNGSWRKTFFCIISDDCPERNFPCYYITIFRCCRWFVNFFLSSRRSLCKSYSQFPTDWTHHFGIAEFVVSPLLLLFCWPCSFLPNWIHLHLLKLPIRMGIFMRNKHYSGKLQQVEQHEFTFWIGPQFVSQKQKKICPLSRVTQPAVTELSEKCKHEFHLAFQ